MTLKNKLQRQVVRYRFVFSMITNLSVGRTHEINVKMRNDDDIELFLSLLFLSKCVPILQKIPVNGKILHTCENNFWA